MDTMLLLKVTLLLSSSLVAAHLLWRVPAIAHHRLWTITFAAALALPLLTFALPALHVPLPPAWRIVASEAIEKSSESTISVAPIDSAPATTPPPIAAKNVHRETLRVAPLTTDWPSGRAVLLMVWLIGTAAMVARLSLSMLRVRGLLRAAEDMTDLVWRRAADALGTRFGLRRSTRLVISPRVATPMAGGVLRPVIFLPLSARRWSAECRDVVLAHEIAHLAGRDPLRHVVARLAVALYWFHPLVWIAAWHAEVAREQACDELVLSLGTRPSLYASVLLDLAGSAHTSVSALAALPMIERTLLERRMMTILNEDTRRVAGRRMMFPAVGMVLLTLSLAAAQPVLSPPASIGAQPVLAPVSSNVAAKPALAAPAQVNSRNDSACHWSELNNSSINISGSDRLIQQTFGDVVLCMTAEGVGDRNNDERPSQWVGRARRVIMEARRGSVTQRLEIARPEAGGQQVRWQVGSSDRPFDGVAQRWRDRVLAILDTTWEVDRLRGDVSRLRGQISAVRGQESALRGEISSLSGEVSAMRGQASSIRGDESALHGQISAINGHVSALRGAISAEQGAIAAVNASLYRANESERAQIAGRIRRHEAEIARIEREIRDYNMERKIADVEREIAALRSAGRTAAIDAEIGAFDLAGKIAAVERRIAALDVQGRVAAIERQIEALDADRRSRQLAEHRESELKALEAAIAAIR